MPGSSTQAADDASMALRVITPIPKQFKTTPHPNTTQEYNDKGIIGELPLPAAASRGLTANPFRINKPQPQSQEAIKSFTYSVLGTALIRFKNDKGILTEGIRALCDSGSQVNVISKDCFSRLGISCHAGDGRKVIAAFGSLIETAGYIDVKLFHSSELQCIGRMRCYIVPTFMCKHPQQKIAHIKELHDKQLNLADCTWDTPGKIDVLIGAGTLASIISNDVVKLAAENFKLIMQNTSLGWVISGEISESAVATPQLFNILASNEQLDNRLRRLWEVDNPQPEPAWTAEELLVEENFRSTVQRDGTGRYIISMAIRSDASPLGRSRHIAVQRLLALEARCKKQPAFAKKTADFIADYIQTGHMVPVEPPPPDPALSYYIPYHAIQKKKFRIVFDGSCPSATVVSYNDQQFAGPKIQADLCEILLLFRTYRYALSADIVKMFRQVLVNQSQWNFQRVLWRPDAKAPFQDYAIIRIVWGLTSATYNAVRALRQCAIDHKEQFPIASAAALSNFYIDDLLSGADTYDELMVLRKQMIDMLAAGGFPLAKWATNNPSLANETGQHMGEERSFEDESGVLGMLWAPASDTFSLRLSGPSDPEPTTLTKRQLISRVAQVYDPSGLFAPIIVIGKMIIQDIWRLKLEWDQCVPQNIIQRYNEFHRNVMELSSISVPRWINYSKDVTAEWHLFSDASECAFGACAYLRTVDGNGTVSCHLVQSRNRVAPIKLQTIPRLELMGAQMAVELWKYVSAACKLTSLKVTFWTDSMIVLRWLRRDPRSLKPFVANRVANILGSSAIQQWRHVPGINNPADLLSRGSTVSHLRQNSIWWNGPPWLASDKACWPENSDLFLFQRQTELEALEIKNNFVGLIEQPHTSPFMIGNDTLLQRCSTLHSLERVTGFAQRFIRNISEETIPQRKKCGFEAVPPITVDERETALDFWIHDEQMRYFRGEAQALHLQKALPATSGTKA